MENGTDMCLHQCQPAPSNRFAFISTSMGFSHGCNTYVSLQYKVGNAYDYLNQLNGKALGCPWSPRKASKKHTFEGRLQVKPPF